MADDYSVARRATWEAHRPIGTAEAVICLCGGPDTKWPYKNAYHPAAGWAGYGAHLNSKVDEAYDRIRGSVTQSDG